MTSASVRSTGDGPWPAPLTCCCRVAQTVESGHGAQSGAAGTGRRDRSGWVPGLAGRSAGLPLGAHRARALARLSAPAPTAAPACARTRPIRRGSWPCGAAPAHREPAASAQSRHFRRGRQPQPCRAGTAGDGPAARCGAQSAASGRRPSHRVLLPPAQATASAGRCPPPRPPPHWRISPWVSGCLGVGVSGWQVVGVLPDRLRAAPIVELPAVDDQPITLTPRHPVTLSPRFDKPTRSPIMTPTWRWKRRRRRPPDSEDLSAPTAGRRETSNSAPTMARSNLDGGGRVGWSGTIHPFAHRSVHQRRDEPPRLHEARRRARSLDRGGRRGALATRLAPYGGDLRCLHARAHRRAGRGAGHGGPREQTLVAVRGGIKGKFVEWDQWNPFVPVANHQFGSA